jgi:hypothetical protein
MVKLNVSVTVYNQPDPVVVDLLRQVAKAQLATHRLVQRMKESIMASVEDFSTEVTELANLLTEQSTDIDTLATFISEHSAELPDSLLASLSEAVDKVRGNSSRLVSLAEAAPEVPTDPAGDPSVPTEDASTGF